MEELDTVQTVKALSGTVDDLRNFIETTSLSDEQLMKLLEAEKQGKNRETAKRLLGKKLDHVEEENLLSNFKEEVTQIKNILDHLDDREDFKKVADTEHLEIERILEVVSGTFRDVKSFVEVRSLSEDALVEILTAEKSLKNRKTVVDFLEKKIDEREAASDMKEVEDDIDKLEEDLKKLEDDLKRTDTDAENDRVEERIGSAEKVAEAMKDIQSGEYDKDPDEENEEEVEEADEDLEESPDDEDVEDLEEADEEEITDEDETDDEEEPDELFEDEEDSDEEDKDDDFLPGKDEGEDDGFLDDENEDEEDDFLSSGEDTDEDDEDLLEEKRDILEELDVEMTDEELREISLDDLKQLRDNNGRRDQLMEELEEEFDRDVLRKASLSDLEKIKASLEQGGQEGTAEIETDGIGAPPAEEDNEETEKDEKEMKEEAEDDLEMLMGAVGQDDEEEEEEDSFRDKLEDIKDFRNNVRSIFIRSDGDDDEENGIKDKKVLQLLERYESLDPEEAAVKTAHIMKGYLEYKEGIKRELTYKELADRIQDKRGQDMQTLHEFFENMHVTQYTGNIDESRVDAVIDASRAVVRSY